MQDTFSQQVLPSTPLLHFSTTYNSGSVILEIQPQSFTLVAQNRQQVTLGRYYDRLLALSDAGLGRALGEFQRLAAAEMDPAFESLNPGLYDADAFTTFSITRQYVRTVQERLRRIRQNVLSQETSVHASGKGDLLMASNDSDSSVSTRSGQCFSGQSRFGISINGFSQHGDAEESDGLSGFDYSMGGAALGLDYTVNEQVVIGAGFGYADTDIDLDSGFGAGEIDSYLGSLYAAWLIQRAYLEGIFTYGNHSYENSRRIDIGEIDGYSTSDHDADAFSALLEGGYDYSLRSWAMQPYASLFYTYVDEERFQESGAGSLNMQVGNTQTNDLASELGLRVSRPFRIFAGTFRPEFKAAWQYNYDIDRYATRMAFAGTTERITIEGRRRPGSALLGAALSFAGDCGIIASVEYDGEIAEDFTANAVFGQVRIPF